ncbi:MAG: hypothetical protein IKI25_04455 [Bacteroidales bacterium]|nr:hypothetical protein [Bacteroidales bacterium]
MLFVFILCLIILDWAQKTILYTIKLYSIIFSIQRLDVLPDSIQRGVPFKKNFVNKIFGKILDKGDLIL